MHDSLKLGLGISSAFLVTGMFTLNTAGVQSGWGPAIFNISSSIVGYGLVKAAKLNDTMFTRCGLTRSARAYDPESMEAPQGWLQPQPVESRRLFAPFAIFGFGFLAHSINLCYMRSNSSLVLISYGIIIGSIFGKSLVDLRDDFDMNSEIRTGYEINIAYTKRLQEVLNIASLLLRYTDVNKSQEYNNALARQHEYFQILNNADLRKLRRFCGRVVGNYMNKTFIDGLIPAIYTALPLPIAEEITPHLLNNVPQRSSAEGLQGEELEMRAAAVLFYQDILNYHFRNYGVQETQLIP